VCGKHSYHGSTILSANASDQDINKFWNIQNPMSVHKFKNADDLTDICKALYDMSFVIIEPVVGAGGVYDWSEYDRQLDLAAENGMKTIIAEMITATPEWAYHQLPHARLETRNGQKVNPTISGSCITGGFPGQQHAILHNVGVEGR